MTTTLTTDQTEILAQSLEEASGGLAKIMRYSGRFMYGKKCLAIDTDYPVETISGVVYDLMADATEASAELARLLAVKHDVRTDALGLGTVVYWPSIELPDDWVDPDDED